MMPESNLAALVQGPGVVHVGLRQAAPLRKNEANKGQKLQFLNWPIEASS